MQKPMRFRAGLVGAGYISDHHVAALRRLRDVEIVGVYDVAAERAAALAAKHGLRAFNSIAALCDAGANVIHVLTPPHTHADVACQALELGCHVLVEKPLTVEVDDCERIRLLAEQRGLCVCVNHSLLFDPHIQKALQIAKSGRIGKVVSLDVLRSSVYPPYEGGPLPPQYRSAGYPFRDLGIHALYLFQAFLGPIENVHADWKSLGGEPNLAFDEWRAMVRCRDGVGQFQLSWNSKPLQSQLIIHGTKGVLRVDLFLMFDSLRRLLPVPKPAERALNAMADSIKPLFQVPLNMARFALGRLRPYQGLHNLVAAFYAALADGSEMPVGANEAAGAVNWTERVARAADRDHQQRLAALKPLTNASILVTGASGSVGSAVVDRLVSDGQQVRILVRRIPGEIPENVEVSVGDLGDPDAVRRAMKGIDTVIHCGAAMKGGWPQHKCATVVGTQNVLAAAGSFGVKKLIHISSLSPIQWIGRRDELMNEESPLEPKPEARGSYTRAKLEAERLVSRFASTHPVSTTIIRPGQIFGGPIPLLTPAVARKLGNRWLVLGDGRVRLPLVHLDDVVEAIVLTMNLNLGTGKILQLVGDECPTQNQVLARLLGPSARIIRLPRAIVFAIGKLSEISLGLLRRQSPLSVHRLRAALSRRTFTNARAKSVLEWQPSSWMREMPPMRSATLPASIDVSDASEPLAMPLGAD